jgi:hypothetical protein
MHDCHSNTRGIHSIDVAPHTGRTEDGDDHTIIRSPQDKIGVCIDAARVMIAERRA